MTEKKKQGTGRLPEVSLDSLDVLGVLEPRRMRIIIPITVPNQKNTGNKIVVIAVRRRHSLGALALSFDRIGCWLDGTGGSEASFFTYLLTTRRCLYRCSNKNTLTNKPYKYIEGEERKIEGTQGNTT